MQNLLEGLGIQRRQRPTPRLDSLAMLRRSISVGLDRDEDLLLHGSTEHDLGSEAGAKTTIAWQGLLDQALTILCVGDAART
jgi:hypothetical protein